MISIRVLDKVIEACLIGFTGFSMFSISLTQLCAGIGVMTWFVRLQITQSWRELNLPLGRAFFVFILACVLAVITSVDPLNSLAMLKKIFLIPIFFWVINVLKDEDHKEFLLKILMISAYLAALLGLAQAIISGVSKTTRVDGTMSIYNEFCECEGETTFIEENLESNNIMKIIDLLGRETQNDGFNIEIYNDGSVKKKYKL